MNHLWNLQSRICRQLTRALLTGVILAGIAITPRGQRADDCVAPPGCNGQPRIDIAFMLDRSGSLAFRGQTWNIMIDGVLRALRDPTIIPRDGSIAISVVVFDGNANIIVPLTDINSADDANKAAAAVDLLKCQGNIHSQVFPCPFGETSWFSGIFTTSNHVNQTRQANPKPDARRLLVLVSDGSTTQGDLDEATLLAEQTRNDATAVSIQLTFNAFLMGVDPESSDFASNKAALDQIVTPKSPKASLGTTNVINPGPCNQEGAISPGDDCTRQANEMAETTRKMIRSDFAKLAIQVTLDGDTLPGVPPSENGISLRQAIEMANCNGAGTITFNPSLKGKTISLLSALPGFSAPDIVINGCDPEDQQGCTPLVTIDGGAALPDGIWIRSNRDTVRGLRIINFTHAGILIAPACPTDFPARNLVENNILENNPAGVVVSDQKPAPRDGFNERNTISRNIITRAAPANAPPPPALIDLGGDGPTPNDTTDEDQGPNSLLNFPSALNVVSSGSGTVTITGQVTGPAVTGATVELYAITASHVVSGNVVIDGVTFLGQASVGSCAISAEGTTCTFTAAGVPVSPTGNYTATATDAQGNTSELMFRSDGKPAAGPSASFNPALDFGTVTLSDSPESKQFDIVNNGNAPLQIDGCSLARCTPADNDDTNRFGVGGCPSPATQINPGEHVTITVAFVPAFCGASKACLALASNDPLHAPILVTLTGQVVSNLTPTLALEGNASSLAFGPTTPVSKPKKFKKLRKRPFHTFTINNAGCNAASVSLLSIRRVTDVPKCISSANADDSRLWVLTQLKSGTETVISPGSPAIGIAAKEVLTFRVRFNPAVPVVVNRTCSDGNLNANEVLPDEVNSVINISASAEGVSSSLAVPLTGKVTKEVRLIDPNDAGLSPAVNLCRSGNDFIVRFSAYDSNQNVDRADFQFMDNIGRIVGQVISVAGLGQAIADRGLAKGQSFTVVQRFTGAADNSQVVNVQVTVFDKEGSSDAFLSGPIGIGCAGVTAQRVQPTASLALPDMTPAADRDKIRARRKQRQ